MTCPDCQEILEPLTTQICDECNLAQAPCAGKPCACMLLLMALKFVDESEVPGVSKQQEIARELMENLGQWAVVSETGGEKFRIGNLSSARPWCTRRGMKMETRVDKATGAVYARVVKRDA